MTFLLFVDNDNGINRILGPCLCTLQYIRLVFKGIASLCIPLYNLPNNTQVYKDMDLIFSIN